MQAVLVRAYPLEIIIRVVARIIIYVVNERLAFRLRITERHHD